MDWRAEGTFNENDIRGLGVKGMGVWDFGWQTATKGWGTGESGDIRLLLHATDPDYLERPIGQPASKGCVRIPAAMNRFLDQYGVLDADYERTAKSDIRFGMAAGAAALLGAGTALCRRIDVERLYHPISVEVTSNVPERRDSSRLSADL